MSFFSPRYGWACDNVANFEIVLASGIITNANATSHPSLFAALKGGSNNFGIVTRFDLKTFPQSDLWGGAIINGIDSRDDIFSAFVELNAKGDEYDEYASVINAFCYISASKQWVIVNNLVYTDAVERPAALDVYEKIQPAYANTMRLTNLSDVTREIDQGSTRGLR